MGSAFFGTPKPGLKRPNNSVIVGEAALAMRLSDRLFEEGVFAQGIGFPTVPRGKARVRTIVTATHTREQLDRAVEILTRVARRMNILRAPLPAA